MKITQSWRQAQRAIHRSRHERDPGSVVILFKDLLSFARSKHVPRGTVQTLEQFIAERGGGEHATPVDPKMEALSDRVSW